ncbi:uncharacterized protein LOC135480931 isoform X2 [Liolophura sinensis]|uniref:uncharacterized protein LOC135480931 isoform X2 n=1 Tax=Liolophura sinensis TaxID=3198878 RepID=UPI00315832FE
MWTSKEPSVAGLVQILGLTILSGLCVLARVTLDVSPNLSINVRKEPIVLDCAFTVATPTEEVTQLTWLRKKSYDRKFKIIVQVPIPLTKGKRVVHRDSHLKRRANITVAQANYGRTMVRMEVKAECQDEAVYRCEVTVKGGKAPPPLDVNVNILEDPTPLSLTQGGAVSEYHQAEFKCSASIGKPKGEISWVMTRKVGNQYENITMGGMVSQRMDARFCSPLAENTLIIEVTGNDITIRCVITRGQQVVYMEKPVDVLYHTRNTEIHSTVNGNKMAYWVHDISAFEGDQIVLNCSSRGRPAPKYTWRYTSTEGDNSVVELPSSSDSAVLLSNATSNLTGTYQCVSANVVSGVNGNDDAEIRLIIKGKMDEVMAAIGTAAIMVGLVVTTICGRCCGG